MYVFQILDKEHRARLEKLDAIKCRAEERAATLSSAKNALSAQLTFVMYGLLAVEQWRWWAARPLTLVPYSGKQMGLSWELSKSPLNVNKYVSMCPPVGFESCIQTSFSGLMTQEVNGTAGQKHLTEEHGQRRPAEANEEEPQNKRIKGIKTRTQSTMTVKCELVTEREKFYLEQIENLQREKMSLRKVRLYCSLCTLLMKLIATYIVCMFMWCDFYHHLIVHVHFYLSRVMIVKGGILYNNIEI